MSIKKTQKKKAPAPKKKPAKFSKPASKSAPKVSSKAAPKSSAKTSVKSKAKPAAKSAAKPAVKKPAKSAVKTHAKTATPAPKNIGANKISAATAPSKAVAPSKIDPMPVMNKTKTPAAVAPVAPAQSQPQPPTPKPKPKPKAKKILDDDLPLDLEEKEDLFEEEKQELAKALREDEEDTFDASFIPTDTSERYILVVDEEGKRRNETVTIISQILPNAIVEVADDPEEALEVMQDCDFDTFVVNFLMPGFSASPFVKAVANHFEHPLLLGFAADKISDAVDPKKGLKIIPLKRLFDLDAALNGEAAPDGSRG